MTSIAFRQLPALWDSPQASVSNSWKMWEELTYLDRDPLPLPRLQFYAESSLNGALGYCLPSYVRSCALRCRPIVAGHWFDARVCVSHYERAALLELALNDRRWIRGCLFSAAMLLEVFTVVLRAIVPSLCCNQVLFPFRCRAFTPP
jgi:hypothetical protein